MGKGFRGICNKCGKEENFFLDCGMMPLDGKERVLFVCPECGTWKLLDTTCEFNSEFGMTIKKLPYLEKLKCKKCDGVLEIQDSVILWD